ncbi:MAG: hypothetical protein D6800_01905 [Candidatus Zixiibacteriota bacterium]|nr:MAG: hypothetical protein D6800_01905 [candidate division Zixibacteria bacterium]
MMKTKRPSPRAHNPSPIAAFGRLTGNRVDEPVCRQALEDLQLVVPFDGATVYTQEASRGPFSCLARVGVTIPPVTPENDSARRDDTRISGEPIILAPPANDDDTIIAHTCKEIMCQPLGTGESAVGLLMLGANEAGTFLPEHTAAVHTFGTCLALVLERDRLANQLEQIGKEAGQAERELKRLHRLLVRQEQLVTVKKLATSINHEINNPLTVIIGNVQYLRLTNAKLPENQNERLRRIEDAAMRISEINQKLLRMDALIAELVGEQASEDDTEE